MTRSVGIVGFGEAGSAVAVGLAGSGTDVVAFDARLDGPAGDGLRQRAADGGVALCADVDEVVARAEVVLSFVTSSAALAVAEALAPHLRADHLVGDCNSTSPGLARQVGGIVGATGAAFADVAVMAAVPPHGHRVPLLASGPGAGRLAAAGIGLQVEVVDGPAGAASAVKMLRSLLVKGLEALLLEFGVAAHRYGVTDQVLSSMNGSLPVGDWRELATYLLGRTAAHASRRGHELEEVAATLRELDVEPHLAAGAARRLLWAADAGIEVHFFAQPPTSHHDVLTALEEQPG